MKRLRSLIVLSLLALALSLLAALGYHAIKWRQIHEYDAAFAAVEQGQSCAEVERLMGHPQEKKTFQPDRPPGAQYIYRVETYYLPIIWTINFENDAVISKRRLD